MFDIFNVILTLTAIVIVCRFILHMRILTALTVGMFVAWIVSGLLLQHRDVYDDFDSQRLAERRMLYYVTSTCAVTLMIIHLFVSSYREIRRARPIK